MSAIGRCQGCGAQRDVGCITPGSFVEHEVPERVPEAICSRLCTGEGSGCLGDDRWCGDDAAEPTFGGTVVALRQPFGSDGCPVHPQRGEIDRACAITGSCRNRDRSCGGPIPSRTRDVFESVGFHRGHHDPSVGKVPGATSSEPDNGDGPVAVHRGEGRTGTGPAFGGVRRMRRQP